MNEAIVQESDHPVIVADGSSLLPQERERLVRFCLRLTGNADDAEDLVQETLLEAWRHAGQLRDPERTVPWLFGIARNVYLRWARKRNRSPHVANDHAVETIAEAGDDVEMDLERSELAELLDRALAMVPESTRRLLADRYVQDLSQAAIAERLGTSEGAVALRLHRARLALRRILLSELREEAATYGLIPHDGDAWEPTRIWCPTCGAARLSAYRDVGGGVFLVRCPGCRSTTSDRSASYLREVQGYTRAMVHSIRSARELYFSALLNGTAPCPRCAAPVRLRRGLPREFAGSTDPDLGVHLLCGRCGAISHQPIYGLALSLLQSERFWRHNRRMRTLPVQTIVARERPALLVRFESVTESNRLEIVLDLEDFRLINVLG